MQPEQSAAQFCGIFVILAWTSNVHIGNFTLYLSWGCHRFFLREEVRETVLITRLPQKRSDNQKKLESHWCTSISHTMSHWALHANNSLIENTENGLRNAVTELTN